MGDRQEHYQKGLIQGVMVLAGTQTIATIGVNFYLEFLNIGRPIKRFEILSWNAIAILVAWTITGAIVLIQKLCVGRR